MDGEMFRVSVSMNTTCHVTHTRATWSVWFDTWCGGCPRGRITKLCCACSGVTVLDGCLPKIEMLSLVLVTCRMLLFFFQYVRYDLLCDTFITQLEICDSNLFGEDLKQPGCDLQRANGVEFVISF